MILSVAAVLVGLIILVWAADRFVLGAAALARNWGVSTLVIGLTIVAFGTSAPELLVSAMAALNGNRGLGIGNAIGSNIANIGLVIGVTALLSPLTVHSAVLRREIPALFAIIILVFFLMYDYELSRNDGILLILALVLLIVITVRLGLNSRGRDPLVAELVKDAPPPMSNLRATMWFLVGLVALLISARVLVWGAVDIAKALGVSDVVIGLTIVAIGTSLPELAATLVSALKNEHDLAIGNIIGSNMFNLLGVMAMPGLISPGTFGPVVMARDYALMFAISLFLMWMCYGFRGRGKVSRLEGGLLLAVYCGYMVFLYFDHTGDVANGSEPVGHAGAMSPWYGEPAPGPDFSPRSS